MRIFSVILSSMLTACGTTQTYTPGDPCHAFRCVDNNMIIERDAGCACVAHAPRPELVIRNTQGRRIGTVR